MFFNLVVLANTMHTDPLPIIGVVTALPAEARVLARVANTLMHRLPGEGKILVRQSGIGLQAARREAERLARTSALLVSTGVSGGLCPGLQHGALVLGDRVIVRTPGQSPEETTITDITEDTGKGYKADLGFIDLIEKQFKRNAFSLHRGTVLCSPEPVSTTAAKLEAHRLTGALAVDMESGAVGEVAAAAGLPFFCLRAICDPAHQTVDAALLTAVDEQGSLRIGRLLAHVVKRPGLLRDLARMASQFRMALISLERAWLLAGEPLLAAVARDTISRARAGQQ